MMFTAFDHGHENKKYAEKNANWTSMARV